MQISLINVMNSVGSLNLPATALLLAVPFLDNRRRLLAVLGAALPLDYYSVLPFGTYFCSLGILVFFASIASRRFPIREHLLFRLLLLALGSIALFLLVVGLSAFLNLFGLAVWTVVFDRSLLFESLTSLLGLNLILGIAFFAVRKFLGLTMRRRFFMTHASH